MKTNVVFVDFRTKTIHEGPVGQPVEQDPPMTLKEAKQLLENKYFKWALFEASYKELERCINASEAVWSGASEAYELILNFRKKRELEQAFERKIS